MSFGRQIWENYKLKSASALSAGFLLLWTLGDSSYLISCAIRIGYGSVLATQVSSGQPLPDQPVSPSPH